MASFDKTTAVPGRPATGTLARILQAIQQRFEVGWVTASVRGGGDFHDAVVTTTRGQTDLSPVFKGADPGRYSLTIYRLVSGKAVPPGRTDSAAVGSGPAVIPALAPGLYQVDISGGPPGTAGSAWVRVVTPDRYGAATKEFAELPSANAVDGVEMQRAARAIKRTYLIVSDETPEKH
jgi:hypothetical protein